MGELPYAAAPWIWPQAERAKDPRANAHLSLGLIRDVHHQKDGGDSIEPDTEKVCLRGIRMNWVQDEPARSPPVSARTSSSEFRVALLITGGLVDPGFKALCYPDVTRGALSEIWMSFK
jgi:hypothetical protein